MDEECIHGITADWCSICRHPYRPATIEDYGTPFVAQFEGWCRGCSRPIEPGQTIRQVGERYGHARCFRGDIDD